MKEIIVDGVVFVEKKDNCAEMRNVIIRADSAGCFYGQIKSHNNGTVEMVNCRRMWRWFGATLSELAQSGTQDRSKCKFPEAVDFMIINGVIEIINLTDAAKKTLDEVSIWNSMIVHGDGSGSGAADGYGSGAGSGLGSGGLNGYGSGYGSGCGSGAGDGCGSGAGDGCGSGAADGSGNGDAE